MSIISEMPVQGEPSRSMGKSPSFKDPEMPETRARHAEFRAEVPPLADVMLEPLVRATLQEDLGRAGDLTSNLIIPAEARASLRLVAREAGVLAGLDLARLAFTLMDPGIEFHLLLRDGARLNPGDEIARVQGPARAILSAERTALNCVRSRTSARVPPSSRPRPASG